MTSTAAVAVTLVAGWVDGAAIRAGSDLAVAGSGATLLVPAGPDGGPHPDIDVISIDEEIAHRSPGCPCCAVRIDLVDRLGLLSRRRRPPARAIVVQAPGSDTATATTTVLDDPALRGRCRLDGILACVPGPAMAASLSDTAGVGWPSHALLDATMLADVVWVSDAGALTAEGLGRVTSAIREVNPTATIDTNATPDLVQVLDLRSWTTEGALHRSAAPEHAAAPAERSTRRTGSLLVRADRALDPGRLGSFFQALHGTAGARLLRVDAAFHLAGEEHRHLALGCRTSLHTRRGAPWRAGEPRSSRLRIVGREIDVADLVDSFQACAV